MTKMPNENDAMDLAGEIFIYCFEHYDSFDPEKSSTATWAFLVANSRLKNYYRDRKSATDISELEDFLFADPTDMDKAIFLTQLRGKMADALDSLPEKQRTIVILRYFKEKSFEEIAEKYQTTPGNIRVILSRTLERLRPMLRDFV